MSSVLPAPTLDFAFEARVSVGSSERIGHGAGDGLCFTPIIGGTFDGPRLRGGVVPGGRDWSVTRGEGTELDAPATSCEPRTAH